MRAAREVAEVAERLQGAVDAHVVWLPVLRSDTEAAAKAAGEDLHPSPVRSTWLPDRTLGTEWAPVLGLRQSRLAWDVVLVFAADARWEDGLPAPIAWWHQLPGEDPARRMGPRFAEDLVRAVTR